MKLRERLNLLEKCMNLDSRLNSIESRLAKLEKNQLAIVDFVGGELILSRPVVIKREGKEGGKI